MQRCIIRKSTLLSNWYRREIQTISQDTRNPPYIPLNHFLCQGNSKVPFLYLNRTHPLSSGPILFIGIPSVRLFSVIICITIHPHFKIFYYPFISILLKSVHLLTFRYSTSAFFWLRTISISRLQLLPRSRILQIP